MESPEVSARAGLSVERLIGPGTENMLLEREVIQQYIERYGGMENFLREFVRLGYVLHGSNEIIDEFEPRVPKKVSGGKDVPANEQEAVYATSEPALPICMAIVSRELMRQASRENISRGGKAVSFGVRVDGSGQPIFYASQSLEPFFKDGYVYVLNRDTFRQSDPNDPDDTQFVAHELVRPTVIVPITPSDFGHEIKVE